MSDNNDTPQEEQSEQLPEHINVLIIVEDTKLGAIKFGQLPHSTISALGMVKWAEEKLIQMTFTPSKPNIIKPPLGIHGKIKGH